MPDIIAIIRKELSEQHLTRVYGEITPDSLLVADLGCDHLDIQTIACALDVAFGFELRDAEVEAWERVADVIATVEKRRAQVSG